MPTENRFDVFSMVLSANGPMSIPINCDLQINTQVNVDLSSNVQQGFIDFISTVYVDNSLNSAETSIRVDGGTNQIIKCPANSQGYFNILAVNPPKFIVSTTGGVIVPLQFLNTPVFPNVWSTPQ